MEENNLDDKTCQFCKKNFTKYIKYLFMFINFGGNCNLKKFFENNSNFIQRIFVIDSTGLTLLENPVEKETYIRHKALNRK